MLGGDPRRLPAEHQRAVAERDRLGDVVGDEDDGLAPEAPQREQVGLQLGAGLRIHGGERLVHQDDGRIVGEGADERRALAHAAGQFVRIIALEAGEPDGADEDLGMRPGLGVQAPLHLDRKQHIVDRRAPRQQVVVLGDIADAPVEAGTQGPRIVRCHGLAVEHDLAGAHCVDLRDHVEQGRFARARGADDGQEFA